MNSSTPKTRRPRLKRVGRDQLPPLQLTPRDIAHLRSIYHYKALTSAQLQLLHDWKAYATHDGEPRINPTLQTRLRAMFHHALISRQAWAVKVEERPLPFIYFLDRKGTELLADLDGVEIMSLDWSPKFKEQSLFTLLHLLLTNDLRVAVTLACQRGGYQLLRWVDDQSLRSPHARDYVALPRANGERERSMVSPDGYFCIRLPSRDAPSRLSHNFVEADRATVSGTSWAKRVATYTEYVESGLYTKRYGAKNMRVLIVTTSEERLENLLATTIKAGGQRRFWFTTAERISPATVLTENIWRIATVPGLHAFAD